MSGLEGAVSSAPESSETSDLWYSSSSWDEMVASDTFIVPFVGNKVGFVMLDSVTTASIQDSLAIVEAADEPRIPMKNHTVRANMVVDAIEERIQDLIEQALDDDLCDQTHYDTAKSSEVLQHHEMWIDAVEDLGSAAHQLGLANEFDRSVFALFASLGLLCRLAYSLNMIAEEYGEHILESQEGIMKITVGVKCLDAAWGKMRVQHKAVLAADEAFWEDRVSHAFTFPFEKYEAFHDLVWSETDSDSDKDDKSLDPLPFSVAFLRDWLDSP